MDRFYTSTAADLPSELQYQLAGVLRDIFVHISFLLKVERGILGIIASYAGMIGLFFLCLPNAVQELVNTVWFAIEPRMQAGLFNVAVVGTIGMVILLRNIFSLRW